MVYTQAKLVPIEPLYVKSPSIGTTDLNKGICDESSPDHTQMSYYTTFQITGSLDKALAKVETCGEKLISYVREDLETGDLDIVEYASYCDNRICENPKCQDHRKGKYKKAHGHQIEHMKNEILVPKSFVYGFSPMDPQEMTKEYITEKCNLVYQNLRKYSRTAFSVHMEIKMYPDLYDPQLLICKKCKKKKREGCAEGRECPSAGMAYLHFHICSGYISHIKQQRSILGCHIASSKAIKQNLDTYMSKYSSKTPYFQNENARRYYHTVTYKTKMHKYSFRCDNIAPYQKFKYTFYDWKWADGADKYMTKYFDDYVIEPVPPDPPPIPDDELNYIDDENDPKPRDITITYEKVEW